MSQAIRYTPDNNCNHVLHLQPLGPIPNGILVSIIIYVVYIVRIYALGARGLSFVSGPQIALTPDKTYKGHNHTLGLIDCQHLLGLTEKQLLLDKHV